MDMETAMLYAQAVWMQIAQDYAYGAMDLGIPEELAVKFGAHMADQKFAEVDAILTELGL